MARIDQLEHTVHGRPRQEEELYFGVQVQARFEQNQESRSDQPMAGPQLDFESHFCTVSMTRIDLRDSFASRVFPGWPAAHPSGARGSHRATCLDRGGHEHRM